METADYVWWHVAIGALLVGAAAMSLVEMATLIRARVHRWITGEQEKDNADTD